MIPRLPQNPSPTNVEVPTHESDPNAEHKWHEYLPLITFDASYEVVYPKNCERKWVILTAVTLPFLALGLAHYTSQWSR